MRVIVQSLASSDLGEARLRRPDGCNMVIARCRRKTLAKGEPANIVAASPPVRRNQKTGMKWHV
ncbi:hypothetical protein [Shinella zoogloeoides]